MDESLLPYFHNDNYNSRVSFCVVCLFFVYVIACSSYAIDGADPESFDRKVGVGGLLSSSDNDFFYMPPPFPMGEGIKYLHRQYVPYKRMYRIYE